GGIAVDYVTGPHGGPERDIGRVAAADTGDQPVGLGKVEAGVCAEGHYGGRRFGSPDSGDDAEDPVVVEAEVAVSGGEGQDLVQVLPLHPELKLARRVARIFAALEHGDDYDFDRDGRIPGWGLGAHGQ